MSGLETFALSRLDTLLLQAALLDGDKARAAFGALRDDFDLDAVDYGRQRLLPLVHRNLTALGIDDPRLGRLRGVRHFHWARNQTRIRATAPLLTALHAAGIPTVLMKGAALIAAGIGDMSLRPMDDIDLLVPIGRRREVIEILHREGFETRHTRRWYVDEDEELATAGWPFSNAAGHEIDLHWYLFHLDCRPGADDGVWSRVRPTTLAGAVANVLDPADQVLHTVVHAARWHTDSILRWAADVAFVLRREGEAMRWDVLVDEAARRRMAPPLHDGLAALKHVVGLAIPDAVLRDLARHSDRVSRFEHRLRAVPIDRRDRRQKAWIEFFDRRRKSEDTMRRAMPATLGPFLRARFAAPAASTAGLLAYTLLGAPRALRKPLGVARWTRTVAPEGLRPISEGFDPAAAAERRDACRGGWSYPQEDGRWQIAREAHLAWRLPETIPGDLEGEIEASTFWPPKGPEPCIDVWLGETPVGRLPNLGSNGRPPVFDFRFPKEKLAGRKALVLTLAARSITSPLEAGVSVDDRRLGAFLRRISFRFSGATPRSAPPC